MKRLSERTVRGVGIVEELALVQQAQNSKAVGAENLVTSRDLIRPSRSPAEARACAIAIGQS